MKGLSPLIATTLLIVMVVTLASIIISFTTTFTKNTQENVENRTNEAVDCSGANIEVDNVFLTNGTAGTARVQVMNNGIKDGLTVVAAQLFNRTGGNFSATGLPVSGVDRGEIVVLTIGNVSAVLCTDFSHVTVSTNCPGATDTFRRAPIC